MLIVFGRSCSIRDTGLNNKWCSGLLPSFKQIKLISVWKFVYYIQKCMKFIKIITPYYLKIEAAVKIWKKYKTIIQTEYVVFVFWLFFLNLQIKKLYAHPFLANYSTTINIILVLLRIWISVYKTNGHMPWMFFRIYRMLDFNIALTVFRIKTKAT